MNGCGCGGCSGAGAYYSPLATNLSGFGAYYSPVNSMGALPTFTPTNVPATDSKMVGNVLIGLGAAVLGILVVYVAARMVAGQYVGRKMGSGYGWFWGGLGGAPGMGLLAAYKMAKE